MSATDKDGQRCVVVSAVNLVEGGTLTVLRDCLRHLRAELDARWTIVALVHDAALAPVPGVEYIAFPTIKRSWLARLRFEYRDCLALSRRLRADLWLALHDITPRVQARRQAVYCHNPMPFHRMSLAEVRLQPKLLLFNALYGTLYRLNIRRNWAVIVQQDWLRRAFQARFGAGRVIVARPVAPDVAGPAPVRAGRVFVYPTLPRVFKNVEVLGEAVALLERDPDWQGRVRVTIAGDENAYARHLKARFGHLRSLEFVGLQTREQMDRLYAGSDALVFPSRLETWGMPLTEAIARGMAVLAADLPYARETIGGYGGAVFFAPRDASALAARMLALQRGQLAFEPASAPDVAEPYAPDWPHLVRLLTADL